MTDTIGIQKQMIGLQTSLKAIYKDILNIAQYNVNCLITGETGTGKELIAQLIHNLSQRRNGAFVKVNCAAIPAELFESELFGYEKGAFTGAGHTKQGMIELADRGTLFLDEIGELPLPLQSKLLRVLNDKRLYKVGGTKEIYVDFRLIAATNVNLVEAIAKKEFRNDLFYRINTFQIGLPPLRVRREDFKQLVEFLIEKLAYNLKIEPPRITEDALTYLKLQRWPGNIRELEQGLTRALVFNKDNKYISLQCLQAVIKNNPFDEYEEAINQLCNSMIELGFSFKKIECDIIKQFLDLFDNNIALISKETGYSIDKLYRISRMFKNRKNGIIKEEKN